MGRVQARSSLGPTSGLSYFLTRLRSGVVGNRLWRIVVGWSLSRRWASLGLIGLASQLLYWNFFLRPYPLLANYAVPLLDLGKLTRRSPAAALDFAAVFVALFALSYAAHSLCRGRSSSRAFALVLLVAFLCGLALVFVYPITAADVFEYIAYARITVEHGVNPHLFRPADFPNDPFMTYSAWPYITSPYGPLWTYVSALIGWMSGASLLTYLLLFKGLALLVHLVNSGLIYATLRRWSSSYALAGAVLYAWNPLVLFESAAGAHNDGAVMLPVLAAIYLFVRRRFALSIVVSALGCLVKMPMIIVVPLFVLGTWRALSEAENRLRTVCAGSAAAVALVILLHAPLWGGWRSLGWLARQGLFTSSFAALAALTVRNLAVDRGLAEAKARWSVLLAFAAFYMWQLRRLRGDVGDFVRSLYWTVFVFLTIAVLWFQPWYVVWVVGLGAMIPSVAVARLTTVFSYTATWIYMIYIFLLAWCYPLMTAGNWLVANLVSVLLVLAPPLGYAAWLSFTHGSSSHQAA
jgi:hypothetical protein